MVRLSWMKNVVGAKRLDICRRPSPLLIATLAGIIVALGQPSARAEFVPSTYEARRTATPPQIDGSLDDAAWTTAQTIAPFYAYQSGGLPAAAETALRLLWDEQFLYLAFEARDADIRSSCALKGACGHDAALYQGDVLELFVRPSPSSATYYEFEWSPLGDDFDARFDTRFGAPGTAWESGLQSAVVVQGTVDNGQDTDEGWIVEARIPLVPWTVEPVAAGAVWAFSGARYDYFNVPRRSTPALMMSTRGDPDAPEGGVTHGFHTYEIYDRLAFVEALPEPGSSGLAILAAWSVLCRRVPRRRRRRAPPPLGDCNATMHLDAPQI